MSGTTTAAAALRRRATGAGANRWVVLVVLCVSLLLVAVDATVLHVAVPAVTEDLRPGAIELLWIVDVYPLVCASLLILFGTLGDRVGRRRVLLLGYALFGVASALAALADNAQLLIVARALLGVGGAMIMPATLSILRQVFPDRRERAMAIGIWSAVAAVGAAVGPLLGGFLLEHFWWGSVFLVNIPLMLVSLPVGRLLLPESKGDGRGPWDVVGALMAAGGLFGVVLGVKRLGGGEPVVSLLTVLPLALGAALLAGFVRRQRRRAYPLVDLAMFRRPAFSTSVGCIVLAMLALVGLELIAAQYLQLVLGLSPLETGLRLLPLTFAAMAAGLAGARLLRRFGAAADGVRGVLPDGLRGGAADGDGPGRQLRAAADRVRAARLRSGDDAVRGVRVDAERGAAGAVGRGGGDRRDLVPAGRRDRYRPAGQRHERGVRARAGGGRAGGADVGVGGGGAFAGGGVRGRRAARGACGGRAAAGRGGCVRARAACDVGGECGVVVAGGGDGVAVAAGDAVRGGFGACASGLGGCPVPRLGVTPWFSHPCTTRSPSARGWTSPVGG
ncbi:MFS family permease [Streptomyces ambofaciens]